MRAQRKLPPILTGADLREHRQRLGISQAELARRLSYSRSYICNLEHGRARLSLSFAGFLLDYFNQLGAEIEAERQRLTHINRSLRQRGA